VNLSTTTRQAYSEVNEIINLLDKDDRQKIPLKLRKYFEREREKEYKKSINLDIPIKEQNLKRETIAIVTMLNLKYICSNEEERAKLRKQYEENEQIYQKKLKNDDRHKVKFTLGNYDNLKMPSFALNENKTCYMSDEEVSKTVKELVDKNVQVYRVEEKDTLEDLLIKMMDGE